MTVGKLDTFHLKKKKKNVDFTPGKKKALKDICSSIFLIFE